MSSFSRRTHHTNQSRALFDALHNWAVAICLSNQHDWSTVKFSWIKLHISWKYVAKLHPVSHIWSKSVAEPPFGCVVTWLHNILRIASYLEKYYAKNIQNYYKYMFLTSQVWIDITGFYLWLRHWLDIYVYVTASTIIIIIILACRVIGLIS